MCCSINKAFIDGGFLVGPDAIKEKYIPMLVTEVNEAIELNIKNAGRGAYRKYAQDGSTRACPWPFERSRAVDITKSSMSVGFRLVAVFGVEDIVISVNSMISLFRYKLDAVSACLEF